MYLFTIDLNTKSPSVTPTKFMMYVEELKIRKMSQDSGVLQSLKKRNNHK